MYVLCFILEGFSPFSVQKFLHKIGSAGGVGGGGWALKLLASAEHWTFPAAEFTAYSWLVGSFISKTCKLCHLLMPPSTVTGVTQQSCLLTAKQYFKVLYNEKEKMLKVVKVLYLNVSSGAKQSSACWGIVMSRKSRRHIGVSKPCKCQMR